MRRLLLYVHYNKFNSLDNHVVHQLKQVASLFDELVFISNSQLMEDDLHTLSREITIHRMIQRNNIGFDFGAWKEAIRILGGEYLEQFESITFMNDSCYGPLWNLEQTYQYYEGQTTIDFWGMTTHPELYQGRHLIKEHLQSYFMVFQGSILKSEEFANFWTQLPSFNSLQETIDFGEIYLTQYFLALGYCFASLTDQYSSQNNSNLSMEHPEKILEFKIPFIKVKAFSYKTDLVPILINMIDCHSDYPTELILRHQICISAPESPHLAFTRKLKPILSMPEVSCVAIILMNGQRNKIIFQKIIEKLQKFQFEIKLYLDFEEETQEFQSLFSNFSSVVIIKDTNYLSQLDGIKSSEMIGVFDLDNRHENKLLGNYELEELHDQMLTDLVKVVANFNENSNLSLVFSDLSYREQVIGQRFRGSQYLLKQYFETQKLEKGCPEFGQLNILIPPLNSFWLRPRNLDSIKMNQRDLSFIVYRLWALNRDFAILDSVKSVPLCMVSKEIKLEKDKFNFSEFEGFSVSDKFNYIFSPVRNIVKFYIMKLIRLLDSGYKNVHH